jgi:hypothetical protein
MKKLLAGLMALGGLGFAGCAVEQGDYIATEAFELNQACYNTSNGLAPIKAALAVAMATEIGRLTPDVDLKKIQVQAQYHWQDALGLTDAAKNQCAARGKTGCPNTQALLELQNPIINSTGLVRSSTLDATNFATDLIASLSRQAAHLQDLKNNQPWRTPANNNVFTMLSVNDWGACGEHVDFSVSGDKPWNQIERLVFFGNGNTSAAQSFGNPYLAPVLNEGRMAIDPDGQLTGTGTTSSGTVTNACIVYSSSLNGAQCTCEGRSGTYVKLRPGTFTCK